MTAIRRTPLVLAAALALAMSSCSGDGQPAGTAPTSSPAGTAATSPAPTPEATADPQDAPQEQAVDAYVGMQRAYLEALETADPDHRDLARYAAGDALQRLRDGIDSIRDQGLRGRGEATFRPAMESLDPPDAPTRISVRDCMDTSDTELYDPSGQPYEDEPGGLRLVIATVEIVAGAWKVTSFGVHEVGTCSRTE